MALTDKDSEEYNLLVNRIGTFQACEIFAPEMQERLRGYIANIDNPDKPLCKYTVELEDPGVDYSRFTPELMKCIDWHVTANAMCGEDGDRAMSILDEHFDSYDLSDKLHAAVENLDDGIKISKHPFTSIVCASFVHLHSVTLARPGVTLFSFQHEGCKDTKEYISSFIADDYAEPDVVLIRKEHNYIDIKFKSEGEDLTVLGNFFKMVNTFGGLDASNLSAMVDLGIPITLVNSVLTLNSRIKPVDGMHPLHDINEYVFQSVEHNYLKTEVTISYLLRSKLRK